MGPYTRDMEESMVDKLISRGFRGRRRPDADIADRIPPGQYLERDFPVLSAGPTPRTSLDRWSLSLTGEVDAPRQWNWTEFQALPREEITRRYPLRDQVDQARHQLARRFARHAARRGRDRLRDICSSPATAATPPICRWRTSPAARPGSPTATTGTAGSGARRPGPAAGSAPLFLEERQMGARAANSPRRDRPGFWE